MKVKLPFWVWLQIPRCGRCFKTADLSNVWVEVQDKLYWLCESCWKEYTSGRFDSLDREQRIAFIKRELPTNFWGRVKFCWKHKKKLWHWIRTGQRKGR